MTVKTEQQHSKRCRWYDEKAQFGAGEFYRYQHDGAGFVRANEFGRFIGSMQHILFIRISMHQYSANVTYPHSLYHLLS